MVDRDYRIVQCNECETYFVSPLIAFSDGDWAKLYGAEYFGSQSGWLVKKRDQELTGRFDKAMELLKDRSRIKFLDVGTGEGKTLIKGLERGWDVTGVDIIDLRVPEAKKEGIKFIQGKFIELDLPENHYDFIYLDSVMEHVLNPFEYLQKIEKLLNPGGLLYIGVPNEDSLFNVIRKVAFKVAGRTGISEKIKPFDTPYHVVGFNDRSLPFIIKRAGLEIKFFRNFGRKMEFLGSPFGSKAFWISLIFLFPIEIIGNLLGKDVYFETLVAKK